MPDFSPNGIVRFGYVPFDNTYKHTFLDFGNAAEQSAAFLSRMDKQLPSNTYTYVRLNNSIRVQGNAENLYTSNYCMFQNANYGNKWFYSFVTQVNYVNENCTEFILELDVLQTWWFELRLKSCMVRREHVMDDRIGIHLNPEPAFDANYLYSRYDETELFDGYLVMVQTNAKPSYDESILAGNEPFGNEPLDGGYYNGVFNGCGYMIFEGLPDEGTSSDDGGQGGGFGSNDPGFGGGFASTGIREWLADMNKSGSADAITNLYMLPSAFLKGDYSRFTGLSDSSRGGKQYMRYTERPSDFTGYVPRNNKLFTYPYCFCRISSNTGEYADLKYELWEHQTDGYPIRITGAVDPDANCMVYPKNYMGIPDNVNEGIVFPMTVSGSWTFSAYQNWSAQNRLSNAVKMISLPTNALLSAASENPLGAIASLEGIGAFAGNVSYHRMQPDSQRGVAGGNDVFANNLLALNIDKVFVQQEFARIIDSFFDMYGYQVDLVKVPNVNGRYSWNYVKCENCAHYGAIPSEDLARINQVFDNGITFWHTWDIGNYSLGNGVI